MEPELFLLFPTPLVKFKLNRHKEHKETYKDKLLKLFNERKGNPSLHFHEHENSYQLFDWKDIEDEQIDNMCQQYANYLSGESTKDTYKRSWFNVHTQQMHQASHTHYGAFFSGIYYMEFDNQLDYPATFVNPCNKDIEGWGLRARKDFEPKNELLLENTFPNYMNIAEGDVILFPPYLTHFVPCSKVGSDKRITYAFNVHFK